jgi:hypothetical protein
MHIYLCCFISLTLQIYDKMFMVYNCTLSLSLILNLAFNYALISESVLEGDGLNFYLLTCDAFSVLHS